MQQLFSLLIMTTLFLSLGCEKESQFDIDKQLIKDHLEANNLEATPTQSGLYYNILEEGGNVRPNATNTVEVRYTGTFLDGIEFDGTVGDATARIPLFGTIEGWQIGLPLIGRGGVIELYIPSYLGYGGQGRGTIPPNTVLVFEIELVEFE